MDVPKQGEGQLTGNRIISVEVVETVEPLSSTALFFSLLHNSA
jgi:hypothetical protein